ncbi:MAG: hypothetical protein LBU60_03195 [Clostridiales bacterium]|nr:hypothetical protein [Clostridiales bacterium]
MSKIDFNQLIALKGRSFFECASFVLQKLLGQSQTVQAKCERIYFDCEPDILQLDDNLFLVDLTNFKSGSFHDYAVAFFMEQKQLHSDTMYSMCPDITASLSLYDSASCRYICTDFIVSQLRRLQLLTADNVQSICVNDSSFDDVEFSLKETGIKLVENSRDFMFAHCVWILYTVVQLIETKFDTVNFFIPFYSTICKQSFDIAKNLGLPIKAIVSEQVLYDSMDSCIESFYDEYGYVPAPECAMSFAQCKNSLQNMQSRDNAFFVVLSTQSAFKYTETVLSALGKIASQNALKNLKLLSNMTAMEIPNVFLTVANKTPKSMTQIDRHNLCNLLSELNL